LYDIPYEDRKEHLQAYLDEYVFRFNRRRTPTAPFRTLRGLGCRKLALDPSIP